MSASASFTTRNGKGTNALTVRIMDADDIRICYLAAGLLVAELGEKVWIKPDTDSGFAREWRFELVLQDNEMSRRDLDRKVSEALKQAGFHEVFILS